MFGFGMNCPFKKKENVKVNSQFEGTFTLLAAAQQITVVLLEPLHLLQLFLFLLLLLLPLEPQPEGLLWVTGVFLNQDAMTSFSMAVFLKCPD